MVVNNLAQRIEMWRAIFQHARPAMPLLRDSIKLQSSDYEVTHLDSELEFLLRPQCGDWFTFLECCIRQDYFPGNLRLEPGDKVLDIGGNFGAFSLMAAWKVGEGGSVLCFEPSPDSSERIKAHARRNGLTNLQVEQCAVGGETGRVTLHLNAKSAYNTTLATAADGWESTGSVEVPVIAITEVMQRVPGEIALAKIDCEGAEYDIIEKIDDAGLARIRAMSMETHNIAGKSTDTIFDKLRDNGFEITMGNPFFAVNTALK